MASFHTAFEFQFTFSNDFEHANAKAKDGNRLLCDLGMESENIGKPQWGQFVYEFAFNNS